MVMERANPGGCLGCEGCVARVAARASGASGLARPGRRRGCHRQQPRSTNSGCSTQKRTRLTCVIALEQQRAPQSADSEALGRVHPSVSGGVRPQRDSRRGQVYGQTAREGQNARREQLGHRSRSAAGRGQSAQQRRPRHRAGLLDPHPSGRDPFRDLNLKRKPPLSTSKRAAQPPPQPVPNVPAHQPARCFSTVPARKVPGAERISSAAETEEAMGVPQRRLASVRASVTARDHGMPRVSRSSAQAPKRMTWPCRAADPRSRHHGFAHSPRLLQRKRRSGPPPLAPATGSGYGLLRRARLRSQQLFGGRAHCPALPTLP